MVAKKRLALSAIGDAAMSTLDELVGSQVCPEDKYREITSITFLHNQGVALTMDLESHERRDMVDAPSVWYYQKVVSSATKTTWPINALNENGAWPIPWLPGCRISLSLSAALGAGKYLKLAICFDEYDIDSEGVVR